jgi:hypothetical protein
MAGAACPADGRGRNVGGTSTGRRGFCQEAGGRCMSLWQPAQLPVQARFLSQQPTKAAVAAASAAAAWMPSVMLPGLQLTCA